MIVAAFFASLAILVYAYVLYPLVLCLLLARRAHSSSDNGAAEFEHWPNVSVLIAAYNEERVIADKIRNVLACRYPGEMELLLVSDGSSDATVDIASELASERVRIIALERRAGKGAALNRAVREARGEILVFTDANAFFVPGAVAALVKAFADPKVGLVTGVTRYPGETVGSVYQRYERMLKLLEARGGTVATADGAIYAIRRCLWRELDPALINDFTHPILVSLAGARSVIAPGAVCEEDFDIANEFARQARMVSQAAMVYLEFLPTLLRARQWYSVLVLTSHKMLRWLTFPLLALLVATSVILATRGGAFAFALWGELLFVALAVVGGILSRLGLGQKVGIAYQFLMLNWAGAVGLWRCLSHRVPIIWEPRGQ